MAKKSIGIIGAGIAGLTAGALLAKKGYDVSIFEKQAQLGGRALALDGSSLTIEQYKHILKQNHCFVADSTPSLEDIFHENLLKNYSIDLGYHAIGGGVLSNLNEVLNSFNTSIDFLESYVGFIYPDHYDFPFLSRMDKLRILPNILRLLFSSEKTLKTLDEVSINDTIKTYGKGKMKHILEIFSRTITTVNNLDRISTGEMIRAQRNLYRGSKPVGYPIGGLGSIHDHFKDIILDLHGNIYLNEPVNKINFSNGLATSLTTNAGVHQCDSIIYSGLLQHFSPLVDATIFPKNYLSMLNSLTGTGSLCAYYSIRDVPSDLIGKTFHFIERDCGVDGNDAVGMIDFMSASPNAKISPNNAFVIQAYLICTPDEARNKKMLNRFKNILDKHLSYLIPQFEEMLNWAIYPSVWHLDGVAKTIDNKKPEIETPIDNLYFIGDGVKARGIGFNCALNSARKLVENHF